MLDERKELTERCAVCCKPMLLLTKGSWSLCSRLECLGTVLPIPLDEWTRNDG